MPRFFVNTEAVSDGRIRICAEDAYHIARSLRMAVGEEVTVCDDGGKEYRCTLSHIRDEEVFAEIVSVSDGASEPPAFITLYMGYPKGDKLETVIQKAVELGACRIVPFVSSRCVKIPKEEKASRQGERLNRIAEEAAKQCGRSRLPSVTPALPWEAAIKEAVKDDVCLFCYEGQGTEPLASVLPADIPARVSVIVGCEGGFSPEEAAAAKAAGCRLVGLGPRILRCETAPAYVLSALSYEYELKKQGLSR